MAVDITNHLIPWAIAKRMQADAWDEGYDIGSNDVGSGWRENELTKKPIPGGRMKRRSQRRFRDEVAEERPERAEVTHSGTRERVGAQE